MVLFIYLLCSHAVFFSFLSLPPAHVCPGLIVVTLAVCWMPNQIRRIMAAAKPKHDWTRSYFRAYMILLPFSDTFFYLSSVINPLLYTVSSRQFRRVFVQVLCCRLSLQHANHEKRLRAHAHSSTDSARFMQRPLLFVASWRHSSARRTKKVFLSTFQGEAEPQSKSQPLNLESLEPNSGTKPADSAAENGFQEHEV
uniref:G-protein coupled receptor 39-like n=1 Tax=Macaca mulatta TaxID=9544 RepID=UPI0010A27C10|nr:G-protein coupled receptor 39-like [Macaca mulatta]